MENNSNTPIEPETPEVKAQKKKAETLNRLQMAITNRSRLQRLVRAVLGGAGVPAVIRRDNGTVEIVEDYTKKGDERVVLGRGKGYFEAAVDMISSNQMSLDDLLFSAKGEVTALLSLDARIQQQRREFFA